MPLALTASRVESDSVFDEVLEQQSSSQDDPAKEFRRMANQQVDVVPAVHSPVQELPSPGRRDPGTADARQVPAMQKQGKSAGVAAHARKFLPHADTAAPVLSEKRLTQGTAATSEKCTAPETPQKSGSSQLGSSGDKAAESLVKATGRSILDAAVVMRQVMNGRLAVVLRPDKNTEIFLRVSSRNGGVEAFARCDRGDFCLLNSHWPELQDYMRQHGIRLSDLAQPHASGSVDGEAGRRSPERREQQSASDGKLEQGEECKILPDRVTSRKTLLELWA
jgi:hypothetical protein